MSIFAIRLATIDDIPQIIDLARQVWWVTYEPIIGRQQCDYMFGETYSPQALTGQMSELKHRFYLLTEEGRDIGFASCSKLEEGVFKLHKIYVTGGSQGKGAGRFLLASVESRVREEGAVALQLNVNRYNKARLFYEAMGYKVLREENIPIGPYWMNDYIMGKRLAERDGLKYAGQVSG